MTQLLEPLSRGPWYARLARAIGSKLLRYAYRHGSRLVVPLDGGRLQAGGISYDPMESPPDRVLLPRIALVETAHGRKLGWWVPGSDAEIVGQLMPEPRHQGSRRQA